jgi:DNA repair protein RadC
MVKYKLETDKYTNSLVGAFLAGEVKLTYTNKIKKADRSKVSSSQKAVDILRRIFTEETIELREQFAFLLLNRANEVIGWYNLSIGSISGTVADARYIVQCAILANASAVILAHNHPSGALQPSQSDITLTDKIANACLLFDIKVLDHIILTSESFYSFADNGKLN